MFRDGIRESVVVTKKFDVKSVQSDHSPVGDTENKFIYDLQKERKVNLMLGRGKLIIETSRELIFIINCL